MKRILIALMLVTTSAAAADRPLVYIESSETMDGSNSRDKAKQIDFGASHCRRDHEKRRSGNDSDGRGQVSVDHQERLVAAGRRSRNQGREVGLWRLRWWLHEVRGIYPVIDNATSGVLYSLQRKEGQFPVSGRGVCEALQG